MSRPAWWVMAYWTIVGALIGVGALAILTIGSLLLASAVMLGIAGIAIRALRSRGSRLIVAGLAAGPLYVAWLNRQGPGDVCTTSATEVTCSETWSPWPFTIVGLLLVVGGVAAFRAGTPSSEKPPIDA